MDSVAHLPADIIGLITRILNNNDVFRLVLCGSKVLNAKIIASSQSLSLSTERFSKFPVSAYSFPNLTSLQVMMIDAHAFYPFDDDIQRFLPPTPLKLLLTLKIRCSQSLRLLALPSPQTRLSHLFPHLTSLSLLGSTDRIPAEGLSTLPEGLLRLAIQSNHSLAIFEARMIASLPLSLETLEFDGAMMLPPQNETWWPDNLKKLVVSNLDCDCVEMLPKSLTWLDVRRLIGASTLMNTVLPPSLLHLSLKGVNIALQSESPWLPRNLSFLRCLGIEWRVSENDQFVLDALYRNMADLTERDTNTSGFFAFPSSMIRTTIGDAPLGETDLTYEEHWPQGLEHLTCALADLDPIVLPRNLLSLEWNVSRKFDLAHLPPHLTRLTICLYQSYHAVDLPHISEFLLAPPLTALVKLDLTHPELWAAAPVLLQLPLLLYLSISSPSYTPSRLAIPPFDRSLSIAAKQLKTLKLRTYLCDLSVLLFWLSPISHHCPDFETLVVSNLPTPQTRPLPILGYSANNAPPPRFSFKFMPRSLQRLEMFLTEDYADLLTRTDDFQHLPRKLTILKLKRVLLPKNLAGATSDGGVFMNMAQLDRAAPPQPQTTEEGFFAGLPPTLTTLHLTGFPLSEHIINVLPSGILQLELDTYPHTPAARTSMEKYLSRVRM